MLEPTVITWLLVISGMLLFAILLYVQFMVVRRPQDQRTKDLVIGKDEDWRDRSHFRQAYGIAWADLLVILPLLVAGSLGVLLGQGWGYVLWAALGAISVYISIVLWFSEREYVYPKAGPLAYYTYIWGFFVYWGIAVVVYSVLRLSSIS